MYNKAYALLMPTVALGMVALDMLLFVLQYLHDTLDSTIKMLLDPNIDCEVDPMKIQCQDNLAANQQSLLHFVQLVWYRIANTQHHFPPYVTVVVIISLCYTGHLCHLLSLCWCCYPRRW